MVDTTIKKHSEVIRFKRFPVGSQLRTCFSYSAVYQKVTSVMIYFTQRFMMSWFKHKCHPDIWKIKTTMDSFSMQPKFR